MPRLVAGICLVIAALASATESNADELFQSHDPLSITLEGPFRKIRGERDRTQAYPGRLTHDEKVYPVIFSVRGNNRLKKETCKHPPLWLEIDKEAREDSLFHKQKRVKLVVLCNSNDKYRDYLRAEYLVYRMLNQLTELSFRVRWVDVTYVGEKDKPRTDVAFFVERKGRLDNRIDHETNERNQISVRELASSETALVALFQYMIANPDFSFTRGPDPEDDCCHNAKLFINEAGGYVPIPYDFDSSGIINTEYAVPNTQLGIRSVTKRLYRGFCRHNTEVNAARQQVLASEEQLLKVLTEDPILGDRLKTKMEKFLRRSFELVREDKRFEKEIIKECRG